MPCLNFCNQVHPFLNGSPPGQNLIVADFSFKSSYIAGEHAQGLSGAPRDELNVFMIWGSQCYGRSQARLSAGGGGGLLSLCTPLV